MNVTLVEQNLHHFDDLVVEVLAKTQVVQTEAEITTFRLRFPRFLLPEFNTHRVFSRNAGSSRAIPVLKQLKALLAKPYIPYFWGANQSGMQASEMLPLHKQILCRLWWEFGLRTAALTTKKLTKHGLHKQWANRPIEPYSYVTVVMTTTELQNFMDLRIDDAAQPEIIALALKIREQYLAANTRFIDLDNAEEGTVDFWHYAFITEQELKEYRHDPVYLAKLDSARCARTSYLTQDGVEPDHAKEIKRFELLMKDEPRHASPTEHQAMAVPNGQYRSGNLVGFEQFRKMIESNLNILEED